MVYTEEMKEQMNTYTSLKQQYDELITSNQYARLCSALPYDMLQAKQTMETLEVFRELQGKPLMVFKCVEEAEVLASNLHKIGKPKYQQALLNDAAFLNKIAALAEQINALVKTSPALNDNLTVSYDNKLAQIAYDCLKLIPKYPEFATYEFRHTFVESCLYSLKKEEIDVMVSRKFFKAKDVESLVRLEHPTTEEEIKREENLKHLCFQLNVPTPLVEERTERLKGVSFPNDDGTSRQEVLKEIAEYKKAGNEIILTTEEYVFEDKAKNIKEPAIRVLWNGKCAGNLSAELVKEIKTNYLNPTLNIEYGVITGGNPMDNEETPIYGMEFKLYIHAMDKIKKEEAQKEPEGTEVKQ